MIRINGRPIESAAYTPEAERAVMSGPGPKKAGEEVEHKDDNGTSSGADKRSRGKTASKN